MTFEAAEATLWRLVQRYTGRVGYRRGVKSEGLSAQPPVIDCSGWTALLLSQALQAENDAAARAVFAAGDIEALHAWSERIIDEIEQRTGFHSAMARHHGRYVAALRDHRAEDRQSRVGAQSSPATGHYAYRAGGPPSGR